jgi:predicted  nucleic acid-binding Zn-ribbon protein
MVDVMEMLLEDGVAWRRHMEETRDELEQDVVNARGDYDELQRELDRAEDAYEHLSTRIAESATEREREVTCLTDELASLRAENKRLMRALYGEPLERACKTLWQRLMDLNDEL